MKQWSHSLIECRSQAAWRSAWPGKHSLNSRQGVLMRVKWFAASWLSPEDRWPSLINLNPPDTAAYLVINPPSWVWVHLSGITGGVSWFPRYKPLPTDQPQPAEWRLLQNISRLSRNERERTVISSRPHHPSLSILAGVGRRPPGAGRCPCWFNVNDSINIFLTFCWQIQVITRESRWLIYQLKISRNSTQSQSPLIHQALAVALPASNH